MYERSAKLCRVPEKAVLAKNLVPVPSKWGLNPRFKIIPIPAAWRIRDVPPGAHQLNGGVFADGVGTGKIVTANLTIVLSYHYAINLDEVAADRAAENANQRQPG